MAPYEVETATTAESGELADLHRRSSLIYEDTREPLLARPDLFGVDPVSLNAGHVRVIRQSGRIIAFATLVPKDGSSAELVDLFVDPEHLRRGIGRALINDAVALARDWGIERIEVDANPNALPFYEVIGFTLIGEVQMEFGTGSRLALEVGRP